jgi:hypothetical protein
LSRDLVGHDVKTARQMSWASIKNSELLALAAEPFDVFLTVDRNLSFQQRLTSFPIAVVILHTKTNRLADLRILLPELLSALAAVQPGTATHAGI